MLASFWHTLWINVVWDDRGSYWVFRAIGLDLSLLLLIAAGAIKGRNALRKRRE